VVTLALACHPAPHQHSAPAPATGDGGVPCAGPLALVLRNPASAQPPQPILTLDAGGRVVVNAFPTSARGATLTPDGCLVGDDGLWAELAPDGVLWTARESYAASGSCLAVGGHASVCVRPDGIVERRESDGRTEPVAGGSMAFTDNRPEARCAALVMLGAFMSMMPSMAVSDGHPPRVPAPAGSRCTRFARP